MWYACPQRTKTLVSTSPDKQMGYSQSSPASSGATPVVVTPMRGAKDWAGPSGSSNPCPGAVAAGGPWSVAPLGAVSSAPCALPAASIAAMRGAAVCGMPLPPGPHRPPPSSALPAPPPPSALPPLLLDGIPTVCARTLVAAKLLYPKEEQCNATNKKQQCAPELRGLPDRQAARTTCEWNWRGGSSELAGGKYSPSY